MRLATVQTDQGSRLVATTDSGYIDLHATDSTLPETMRELLADYPGYRSKVEAAVQSSSAVKHDPTTAKLLPPVTNPEKILCIGLNYRDHAIEAGQQIPTEPVIFGKFTNALIAHGDPIVLPKVAEKVDYEAELVLVIGKPGKNIPNDESAMEHIAGYTVGHDVSARDWQFKGAEKQWIIGKTPDTFAPTGPVIVTKDEVPDPHNLQIQLRLNGETMQNSSTKEFIFRIPHLLHYISQLVRLEPGDLIFTGTPPGVGIARKPQVLLKHGDVVDVEIAGIGLLSNPCVAE